MWRQALSRQYGKNTLRRNPYSFIRQFTTTQAPPQNTPPESKESKDITDIKDNKETPRNPTKNGEQASSTKNEETIRKNLYSEVLSQVPQHGWTSASVHAALASLNLSPASSALFAAGIASVAARLDADCNRQLALHLFERQMPYTEPQGVPEGQADGKEKADAKIDSVNVVDEEEPADRAAYAMKYRLSLLDPYHQFWYQAVSLRARTPRKALRNRLLLTDEIAAHANYPSANVRITDL